MICILSPVLNDSVMYKTPCLIVVQSNNTTGSVLAVIWPKNYQQIQFILIVNI